MTIIIWAGTKKSSLYGQSLLADLYTCIDNISNLSLI